VKKWFIRKCPNWLFPTVSNAYYSLSSKEKVKIKKVNDGWLVQKGSIRLFSPTPKFLGFGMKEFKNKCERFFKIEEGDTALDVGACIGDTTVPMALKTGPSGKVIAAEPHPLNLKYLRLNLSDFNNVEIVDKALWNQKGTVRFHVHSTPTGHSILEDEERDSYVEVQSDTLDNLFADRKIDFAKIDVQGAEAQVLEGGDKFLKVVRKLAVETHARYDAAKRTYPRVLDILNKYDFEIHFAEDNGVVYAWR
jgi:FkbM family methyltransferase